MDETALIGKMFSLDAFQGVTVPIGSLLNVFSDWHHKGSAIIERKKEPAAHQPKPVSAYQRYYRMRHI